MTVRSLLAASQALRTSGDIAARLDGSVIRPLNALVERLPAQSVPVGVPISDDLWSVAQSAVAMCDQAAPVELLEAAAALADLACRAAESDAAAQERRERLAGLLPDTWRGIRLSPNGPLLALRVGHVTDWLGQQDATPPVVALCRCGASALKPYCDGSHARIGFADAKDPQRVPDRLDTYVGEQVTIFDNRGICQHSGFCTDRLSAVFRAKGEPFVAPSGGRMDEIVRAVRDCPSGALGFAIDGIEQRETTDWHGTREPGIEVSKDGPYRVVGNVPLVEGDGTPVARNAGTSLEHYALCRCGHSQNKPFCSGMHWNIEFKDPVAADGEAPTVFEWGGGLPALTRMTRIFYEKYVPNDELLAPLFANMSPDHPERVAKWLAEVFCGPKYYSEEYGGYPRMLSQHVGKGLTEEMRQRWVTLLLQSARDAGLPNDAEFASVFAAYIQWGSRLAVENSQTSARPPQNMPMPHWGWETSAGPPGARISALAPQEVSDAEPQLPTTDEPLHFEAHVKPLFRKRDRDSMLFKFDLWKYDDVKTHAASILDFVSDGRMPCDKAWPKAWVDLFAHWIAVGAPQ